MSEEQSGASSSGAGCSAPPKAKKSKSARNIKAAKTAKKNAKIERTATHDTNQAKLMKVFSKLSLIEDDTATAADDAEIESNAAMDIEPKIDNACNIPEEIPADNEQRDDDEGEEAAAAIIKPRHRRRRNRKAKNARAFMISGAQPIKPKKTEPSLLVEPAVPTLSYSHVVSSAENRESVRQISPKAPHREYSPTMLMMRNLEGSDTDDYLSGDHDSADDRWEQDYEDIENWKMHYGGH